jgi:acyl-CoA thioester hydrolase
MIPNISIADFHSIYEIKIAWGDQDAALHVNNTMYLRYAETARIQYMEDIGLGFYKGGDSIILADTYIKFIYPLTFPDTISVGTRCLIDTIDETSFKTEQAIFSQKVGQISALITAKIVCYDYVTLRKTAWSKTTLEALKKYEKLR